MRRGTLREAERRLGEKEGVVKTTSGTEQRELGGDHGSLWAGHISTEGEVPWGTGSALILGGK